MMVESPLCQLSLLQDGINPHALKTMLIHLFKARLQYALACFFGLAFSHTLFLPNCMVSQLIIQKTRSLTDANLLSALQAILAKITSR